ncbi:Zn-ribbon domain-containing OB-fold protein [Paenibacillus koleovorans]|uniref:Zn-ribbon domain-containing OB-fold protein n=1 Tax=Paenibacillus koleovorans TaxID=121608 RepID=UPI000FDA247D|nr:Zn-ribbon domain-containing OB-fold protein [Paenibacillus koleovorans]
MADIVKPVPIPDGDSMYFWERCNEGKLVVQHCADCGRHVYYPRAYCPRCMSGELEWVECLGRGTVYSYTVAYRPSGPAFADDCPYVVALIDLAEGVRMMSNIVNAKLEDIHCDMQVEVVFKEVGEVKLPMFQPIGIRF